MLLMTLIPLIVSFVFLALFNIWHGTHSAHTYGILDVCGHNNRNVVNIFMPLQQCSLVFVLCNIHYLVRVLIATPDSMTDLKFTFGATMQAWV